MLQKLKKGIFPFIIAFSALSVSASAAFYSVSGLSKLFAGAAFEVIIMAGSLEIAKLVIASLLYQYWDTINKSLRTYLTVATIILVLITSMGIYGFLSSAYQDTYRQLTIKENQISFLDQKKQFHEKDVTRYDQELERISNNISTLSNAKVSNIQVRDTLRTTLMKDEQKLKDLKNEALRAKVEETYNPGGRFDGLGAYYNAIQPVKIDAPTINKLENNISGQPSVDNARFGIGLININSSIAGY